MRDEIPGAAPHPDATEALSPFLTSENEVLRCAATRALATARADDTQAKNLLETLLLDPDPDVRSDAMAGFARLAGPEDTPTLRRSLEGDPVREVKLAAIDALARLSDAASVDLLRALVLSRAEDRVAWEDEDGDWDDWLDIQIAVIDALGRMDVQDAIKDMLAARDDEFGQTLDIPVFNALGRMGNEGAIWLLAVTQTEIGLARKRAVGVLADMAPDALRDHVPELLGSDDAELRIIAVRLLPPESAEAARLVTGDPAAEVRLAALDHCLIAQPDLAREALKDSAPKVQAAALAGLPLPLEADFHDTLVDNMLVWIAQGAPDLMMAAARHLPRFAPNRAEQPLLLLIADADRPLEARVAAVRALGDVRPEVATATLATLLENPAQQVRTAALTLLRDRAGDDIAQEVIAAAILGALLSEEAQHVTREAEHDAPDVAAPKGEGEGPGSIRITRDGDIVATQSNNAEGGGSTLASIMAPMAEETPDLAEDTPEESSSKRRKRRPVEGPDAIATALMREALSVCGMVAGAQVEAAVLTQTRAEDGDLRRVAWQALRARCETSDICGQARHAAETALSADDPVIRLAAFDLLCVGGLSDDHLAQALSDPDALIRAGAVEHVAPEAAIHYLGDDAQPVRRAALRCIAGVAPEGVIRSALDRLIAAERADTLGNLILLRQEARAMAFEDLVSDRHTPRRVLVLLNALACDVGSASQGVTG